VSHHAGFQVGTGVRNNGSMVPNAIEITTYSGSTNSTASQMIPGAANAGQYQRG
jgi:hypothetical protein